MGKKLESTPRSRVRSAIRQVFLRSRERAAALKAGGNKCACCGVKASKAKGREQKVEVHHAEGIGNWENVIDLVYEEILCHPSKLVCLCPACHHEPLMLHVRLPEVPELTGAATVLAETHRT